ncbi:hypothetical protein NC651_018058 [Populus alba x Populus x berolinensis]|nr:hypothetical protein NC651_018058 [Populus alba x Populus x berolinensis]
MERLCTYMLTVTDDEGLQHVYQELEAKFTTPFASDSGGHEQATKIVSLIRFQRWLPFLFVGFYVSDDLALSNFLVYLLMHSFGHLCSSLVTIVFTHECSNSQTQQPPASKGPYSQVGFSYDGDGKEETHFSDGDDSESEDEDDDDDEDFNSDDSNDEGMETIAKEFGVKRYGWLVYMDKKAKEEEKRQKEVIKGDPAIRKMSRKERRKASQIERDREREAARITGTRVLHHDPYRESRRSPTYEAYSRSRRSRSTSRSYSPSHSRRYTRGGHLDEIHHSKSRTPKIEYITEFGGSYDRDEPKLGGYSPPLSPPSQADVLNRSEHLTFNSCKDRLDSLYCAAAYPFCYLKQTLWFRIYHSRVIFLTDKMEWKGGFLLKLLSSLEQA